MIGQRFALAAAVMAGGLMAMPAQAGEITLKGASCFPIGSPPSRPFEAVVDAINKQGKGVIQVKMIGGAPAIGSPFTLTQKMSKGAYDIVGCTEAYFGNVLPEAAVMRFSEYSYAELRRNGALDYMQKLFNAKGIQYIARHHTFGTFHLYTNKKITGADLKGMNIRVSPVYTAFFKSLGATVQTSTIAQVYTYMENNTVQGFGWPLMAWVPAWAKVTKYRVDPGFYDSTLHTLVNLKKWNSLDQAQQALLNKIGLMFETKADPASDGFKAMAEKQKAWFKSKGIETIELSGMERDKWAKAAKAEGWKEVLARSPKHGAKLQKLFTK
jgi:TRAP-type C4-dicarboxylate transport system substrate-binding protein